MKDDEAEASELYREAEWLRVPRNNGKHTKMAFHLTTRSRCLSIRAGIALVVLSTVQGLCAAEIEPDDETTIRAMIEASRSHRESFDHVTCRFAVSFGECRSVQDALAGRWAAGSEPGVAPGNSILDGYWIARGDWMKCTLTCRRAGELFPSTNNPNSVMVSCGSEEFLTDGRYRMIFSVEMKAANIGSPDGYTIEKWGPNFLPFSMGMMGGNEHTNPYLVVTQAIKNGYCRLEGTKKVSGVDTIVIATGTSREDLQYRFYLDPNCRYLPRQIDYFIGSGENDRTITGIVTHVKELTNDRWFPMRTVRISNAQAPDGERRQTCVIETATVDIGTVPPTEAFVVELPANSIVEAEHTGTTARIEDAVRVDFDALQSLQKKATATARLSLVPPEPSLINRTFLVIINIVLLLFLLGWAIWRRTRMNKESPAR